MEKCKPPEAVDTDGQNTKSGSEVAARNIGYLYKEIDKGIRARATARTFMLTNKLRPMARQVFWQDIKNQRAHLKQQEINPPGVRPPPEPPPASERTWSPRPREEQIELLNFDDVPDTKISLCTQEGARSWTN